MIKALHVQTIDCDPEARDRHSLAFPMCIIKPNSMNRSYRNTKHKLTHYQNSYHSDWLKVFARLCLLKFHSSVKLRSKFLNSIGSRMLTVLARAKQNLVSTETRNGPEIFFGEISFSGQNPEMENSRSFEAAPTSPTFLAGSKMMKLV